MLQLLEHHWRTTVAQALMLKLEQQPLDPSSPFSTQEPNNVLPETFALGVKIESALGRAGSVLASLLSPPSTDSLYFRHTSCLTSGTHSPLQIPTLDLNLYLYLYREVGHRFCPSQWHACHFHFTF